VESIFYKSFEMVSWDIGGRDKIRSLLRFYLEGTDAIIWVVDSNDRERIPASAKDLEQTLQDVPNAILLVLANKQDLPNAMNINEVFYLRNYS
jgi:GTPase SAR1 family protein